MDDKTNDKAQANLRKDGMGIEDIGEGGDGGLGGSATEANSQPNTHEAEGAHGDEHGSHGRRSPANKQGLDGNIKTD